MGRNKKHCCACTTRASLKTVYCCLLKKRALCARHKRWYKARKVVLTKIQALEKKLDTLAARF